MKNLKRVITLVTVALGLAAVSEQLQQPKEARTWHGTVLGVPYDFRFPTPARIKQRWWNPDDERLFTPHVFGIGWSVNLYRLLHGSGPDDSDEARKAA
jgi:Family of unknown function (DUF5808)